jgi:hypothetical protein
MQTGKPLGVLLSLAASASRLCLTRLTVEVAADQRYGLFRRTLALVVMPARPLHPRDKAKVEVAVQVAQRWLLARIRDEVFHSLGALNARLRELLVDLNGREMRWYGKSRRALFEEIERAALRPLPSARLEYEDWRRGRVHIDYQCSSRGKCVNGRAYPIVT